MEEYLISILPKTLLSKQRYRQLCSKNQNLHFMARKKFWAADCNKK